MTRTALAAIAGALALAGCSALGATPTTPTTASTATTPATTNPKVAQAQATHEYPSPPPPAQQATGTAATPLTAISAFASAYINWQADTVTGDLRALAASSIGQARSAMQLAAAQTAGDVELQRGGIANSGTVQAIARKRGARDTYVVVTLERTTATATDAYQGLRPAWHVALATVAQLAPGEWVVSGWQPET